MIRINHLRKEYEKGTPLQDVCTSINDGDIIAVIGPSGTGKSTLIRCLNLLEKPTSGEIYIGDTCITDKSCDINKIRQKMGMVFQSFNLFPHMNVLENIIAAPMDILKKSREEAEKKAMELLDQVGLANRADSFPDELSGGQKQRVAIARALAMEPEIIFFDEPTSALDPTMVGEVMAVIRDLAKRGLTMMIVTHEMRFAREISNRVFYMDQGGIYEDGSPEEIFDHPKRNRTRLFIQQMQVVYERVEAKTMDLIALSSKMEVFGRNYQMEPQKIDRAVSVMRKICTGLCTGESAVPHIHFLFEYSAREDTANLSVLWKGNGKNPFAGEFTGLFKDTVFTPGEKNDSLQLIGLL